MAMEDVTQILNALSEGDDTASDRLIEAVYEELRRVASNKLSWEKPGQTLQATALVHEAWLRLVGNRRTEWQSRGHFFSAAAEAMRRILVDRARRKRRLKHGGGKKRLEQDLLQIPALPEKTDLIALDEALARLHDKDPIKSQIVKLRFFTGLSIEQAAEMMGISRAAAYRHWTYARAWLYDFLFGSEDKK
ncbi:MAG: sigma-70 family RNA polymerase sigma factor [Planctomycetota bacterium]|jgi:RNA polymerase sigma factor (TIGR02999 family)